jgi:sugar phosphate isomerase/epimerase
VSLHVKDKAKGYDAPTYVLDKPDPFTEVGNGVIDWKHVLEAAPAGGLKYPFVEQDYTHRASIFESLQMSYDYLKKLPLKNLSLFQS